MATTNFYEIFKYQIRELSGTWRLCGAKLCGVLRLRHHYPQTSWLINKLAGISQNSTILIVISCCFWTDVILSFIGAAKAPNKHKALFSSTPAPETQVRFEH